MFSFHKSKIFRSLGGCCICKAKSSSSRFTDSKRYEMYFAKCFSLEEERSGEICNACVLLVKRFIKLPLGSSRNWSHVVDARSGPGIKSVAKAKKQLKVEESIVGAGVEGSESPDKFKRKHVYQRKPKPQSDRVARKRHPSIDISPFLDMSFWKREKICCGTIFRAPNGEVAVDERYISPCEGCKKSKNPMFKFSLAAKENSTGLQSMVTNSDSFSDEKIMKEVPMPKSSPCESQSSSGLGGEFDDEFFDKRSVNAGLYTPSPETEPDQSVPTNSDY